MNDHDHRRLSNEFKRKRHLRTNNPFCQICGKDNIWSPYEMHHPDLKHNSPDKMRICQDCHKELHVMLNEFPRIPTNVPKSRHRLIHMARGQIAIARLSLKKWGEIEEWLLNVIDLPQEPEAANDDAEIDDDDGEADQHVDRPEVFAELEARLAKIDAGTSQ